MSKYNKTVTGRGPTSVLTSEAKPTARTGNGAPGAVRDSQSELFVFGVNLMAGGEDMFYEKGKDRDKRFTKLVEKNAIADPSWTYEFIKWLRAEAYVRTASLVAAAHFVNARLNDKQSLIDDADVIEFGDEAVGLNRAVVSAALKRADEPGEFIAYWQSKFKKLPKAAKRGLADAVNSLYNEYSWLKYGTSSHAIKFSDVLNLTHPKPENGIKADLFKFIIDNRYENETTVSSLAMINANKVLRKEAAEDAKVLLDSARIKAAGMTWEDVLSLAGTRIPKKKIWEALIDADSLGLMALIRNLRNMEEATISEAHKKKVIDKITNPEVVAKSMQFPFRFLSAYKNTNSLQFQAALETALSLSCQNIPELNGNTLVLVDVSGSMTQKSSNHSSMSVMEIGAIFGAALAAKNPKSVDLVAFGTSSAKISFSAGESVLPLSRKITSSSGRLGGGTNTAQALQKHFDAKKHKRVIIITDEQTSYASRGYGWNYGYSSSYASNSLIGELCPPETWMYAFNLAGYKVSEMETGKNRRYQLGGLTDHTFRMIPLLESGLSGSWPWVQSDR